MHFLTLVGPLIIMTSMFLWHNCLLVHSLLQQTIKLFKKKKRKKGKHLQINRFTTKLMKSNPKQTFIDFSFWLVHFLYGWLPQEVRLLTSHTFSISLSPCWILAVRSLTFCLLAWISSCFSCKPAANWKGRIEAVTVNYMGTTDRYKWP